MITKIVLADDHQIVRQGLRALLEAEDDLAVVGEADTGLEALQLVERLQPHVLVLDIMMPELGGLEVTHQIKQRSSQTEVVILSMYTNKAYVARALKNGAAAYVLKKSTASDLVKAVRAVAEGQTYLSPPLSNTDVTEYVQQLRDSSPDPMDLLTAREREVLHLVARGYTSTEVAERLFISPRTVEMHRANLMRKLELKTQVDLVHFALKKGILPLEANDDT